MKIAVMQPYLFPYIGYFQLIHVVDTFVIFDDVNYIKKGWINRNKIIINEKEHLFTIPVKAVSQNRTILDHCLSDDMKRRRDFLDTLEQAYRKAPEFNKVFPIIWDITLNEESNLVNYIEHSLKTICSYLDISTTFLKSSEIRKGDQAKGQEKIIEICKALHGNHYINAIGGVNLYSNSVFYEKNIKLSFLQPHLTKYKQFEQEFIPWLSIIDVLMFASVEKINVMLNNFTLIEGDAIGQKLP